MAASVALFILGLMLFIFIVAVIKAIGIGNFIDLILDFIS